MFGKSNFVYTYVHLQVSIPTFPILQIGRRS